jgi:hypothetical protein
VLGLERLERRSRLVVIHCDDSTLSRTPPEPGGRSDEWRFLAADWSKGSRQRARFVFYYAAVTTACRKEWHQ